MAWLIVAFLVSAFLWLPVVVLRFLDDCRSRGRRGHHWPHRAPQDGIPSPSDVAALIAARNEGLVIGMTIASACTLLPLSNIYVVSDGSSDVTAERARAAGVNVLVLNSSRGKGGALAAGIQHFQLCWRYEVVLILDADTVLSPDYLKTGLPLFAAKDVVAVAGQPRASWQPGRMSWRGQLLSAYREVIYLRAKFAKYGQAWRHANAVMVAPGFASMYRTSALAQIEVDAPGLVVEDMNMTFEIHSRRLGRIAFHPRMAIGYTQEPESFRDYVRQVRRWSLVLWQTVRRHGFLHSGFFWAGLTSHMAEVIASSTIAILFPLGLVLEALAKMAGNHVGLATGALGPLAQIVTIRNYLIVFVLPQYLFTVLAAVLHQRPRYLLMGLGFPLLGITDAALALYTLPCAWIERSTGAWISPTRRRPDSSGPRRR